VVEWSEKDAGKGHLERCYLHTGTHDKTGANAEDLRIEVGDTSKWENINQLPALKFFDQAEEEYRGGRWGNPCGASLWFGVARRCFTRLTGGGGAVLKFLVKDCKRESTFAPGKNTSVGAKSW